MQERSWYCKRFKSFYALLLKLFACFNFFRMRGEVQRDGPPVGLTVVEIFNSFGDTPSSTSSASVFISIF